MVSGKRCVGGSVDPHAAAFQQRGQVHAAQAEDEEGVAVDLQAEQPVDQLLGIGGATGGTPISTS
jgi:hypothetical protein